MPRKRRKSKRQAKERPPEIGMGAGMRRISGLFGLALVALVIFCWALAERDSTRRNYLGRRGERCDAACELHIDDCLSWWPLTRRSDYWFRYCMEPFERRY